MHKIRRALGPFALALLFAAPVSAATIRTVDDKTLDGSIVSLDAAGLQVQKQGDPPQHIPLADLVSLSFTWSERVTSAGMDPPPAPPTETAPAKPPLQWQFSFENHDRCTGSFDAWIDSRLALKIPILHDAALNIPIDQLRAFWSAGKDALVAKALKLPVPSTTDDVAYVEIDAPTDKDKNNKDVKPVAGLALGLDGEFLKFKYDGEERKIKLDRLVGLVLAKRDVPPATAHCEVFTLSTGEVISGRILEALTKPDPKEKRSILVSCTIAPLLDPDKKVVVPASKLDSLAVRNGRLAWLGDLQPASVDQAPYFDRLMPYKTDQSLTGTPLSLLDGAVEKGLAVHARCFLTYDLAGQYEIFRAKVGFQQPDGKIGRADLRILADDKILWQQSDFKGTDKPLPLELNVTGVKSLRLEVDFGKNQDVGDQVVWGNARLIKPAAKTDAKTPAKPDAK